MSKCLVVANITKTSYFQNSKNGSKIEGQLCRKKRTLEEWLYWQRSKTRRCTKMASRNNTLREKKAWIWQDQVSRWCPNTIQCRCSITQVCRRRTNQVIQRWCQDNQCWTNTLVNPCFLNQTLSRVLEKQAVAVVEVTVELEEMVLNEAKFQIS